MVAEQAPESRRALADALVALDEVAPAWNAWDRLARLHPAAPRPARWIGLVHECAAIVELDPAVGGAGRRALGEARKSMRDPAAIGPALVVFRDAIL